MAKLRRALLSVSDKSGLVSFARSLQALEIELIATGGTGRTLVEAGLPIRDVADLTGFPEMMDGRVKTLHPRVHGGILARRDLPEHVAALEEHGIAPIDMVVVNLYPFEDTIARPDVTPELAIENIDIGGPSMLRSAAKNHAHVAVVCDPGDYERLAAELAESGGLSDATRRHLAVKAFAHTAAYDTAISGWLRSRLDGDQAEFPEQLSVAGRLVASLRYGENPHQRAAVYSTGAVGAPGVVGAEVLGGKELSYNNYLDLDAALRLALEFDEPFACVLKHNNPCGAAVAESSAAAIAAAWEGDPLSAYGSVLGFRRPVDLPSADFLVSGGRFVEAIVAPGFQAEAVERLRSGAKWGKNVRLLACPAMDSSASHGKSSEVRLVSGGFLVQGPDASFADRGSVEVVTKRAPTEAELRDLLFAERVVKHVKSNAIVLAKGTRVLGVGAGQMSRVDSVRLAVEKAGDEAVGAVLASDAFFPFADGVEVALDAGVTAVLQPGGSIRDDEVRAAVDSRGAAMVFTGLRHFRH